MDASLEVLYRKENRPDSDITAPTASIPAASIADFAIERSSRNRRLATRGYSDVSGFRPTYVVRGRAFFSYRTMVVRG